MKKLLLLLIIPLLSFGQIKKLDDNYGYKSIKFDSPISQFETNLVYINEDKSTVTFSYEEIKEYSEKKIDYKTAGKETLESIANKYNISYDDIITNNPTLKNPKPNKKLKKGTDLKIVQKTLIKTNYIDNSLFDIFGEEFDIIHLIFDKKTNLLVGIEIKTKIKKSYSAQIMNVCASNILSLVNKYKAEIGTYSKMTQGDITNSCRLGKIIWIGDKVVLKVGLDNPINPKLGGVGLYNNPSNMMKLEYLSSKSVSFYKTSFYNKSVSGF